MIRAKVKVNPARFQNSFRRFTQNSKRAKGVVMKGQVKLFVRDVVGITPPNQDFKISPELGENAIRGDLAAILIPSRRPEYPEAVTVHKAFRTRMGRVDKRRKAMPARNVAALRKLLLSRVGLLASGWNAAAQKFGTRLPKWITRHGTRFGTVSVAATSVSMKITIVNAVRYAGAVRGLQRRVQAAMDNRARQMDKQMKHFAVRQAARQAGLKIR